jgi:hypothetical protein
MDATSFRTAQNPQRPTRAQPARPALSALAQLAVEPEFAGGVEELELDPLEPDPPEPDPLESPAEPLFVSDFDSDLVSVFVSGFFSPAALSPPGELLFGA